MGKSREEIELALKAGILMFNVESLGELLLINDLAESLKLKANISFRVNPEVNARTHPYITTGMRENKFGITFEEVIQYSSLTRDLSHINLVGIDCHIGSQITDIEPYLLSIRRLKQLYFTLTERGYNIQIIDIGGGLGISYQGKAVPGPEEWSSAIVEELKGIKGVKLIVEPGRSIVASSGAIIGKVLYQKSREGKNFLIVDIGMNNLIRPSLYNAYHDLKPVLLEEEKETAIFDVVGPLCETADFLGKERNLPWMQPGDLLAVMDTGAYGFSLASNYNSKPKAAELLVKGNKFYLIRKKETFEDLINNEIITEV
ncbi:MAG: Diaminopimelate decarboxylase [candidate division WS2 bacterium]|uniref:Diaminopimelate decarboxylase n=1 Tax=Psychracetigena formicireducens TaxID=2986056 RepID=A0A9E2BHA6_PSYF1|nr:Diaminopimelate decarboxylase [Candidatus Psychracetigena formicireducens]MBT9145561.1 Diaminopimelate decarboxylase [Candidatus Psychracetigena formicireducens]